MTENGSGSAPENGLETVAKAVPETAQEYQSEEQHTIEYVGDAADIIPIAIKNLIFNILTLSLYRFWGRTEVRRHIWSNIRIKGDPLEYTGTGGEMFIGFLVVLFLVFLPMAGLVIWGQVLIEQGETKTGAIVLTVVYITFLFLYPMALYRSLRYRLSRTRWRGVRGAQIGSGLHYASEAFAFVISAFFTLGMTLPLMDNRLFKVESRSRRFGSGKFSYDGGVGRLYLGFLMAIAVVVLGYILQGSILFSAMDSMIDLFEAVGSNGSSDGREMAEQLGSLVWIVFFALFSFYLLMGLAVSIYGFFRLSHFMSNTAFEDVRFSFSCRFLDFFLLQLSNFFINIFTFGVLNPLVQLRTVKFVVSHTSLTGPLDLAAITQSDQPEDAFGEGLAEGFDIGTI